MDAHTLNAWTRFALQKGGIGSCTALVDNPATDPEDLMFMTGEKIIVLRRLDNDDLAASAASSSGRRKSVPDAESCFLGYCEGVVGRFKGSHVQIHGKLKKPVLMRRSGQGQMRDSSTKLLSQQDAASLPAAQVTAGVPVTAIHSNVKAPPGAALKSSIGGTGGNGQQSRHMQPHTSAVASHTRPTYGSANGTTSAAATDDTDSDDSDTMLPWAKISSSDSSDGEGETQWRTLQTTNFLAPGSSLSPQKPSPTDSQATSSFSHRSSLTQSANSHQAKSPSQSTLSSAASASDEDNNANRRDQTFSIYDVYGRDSVAFPNFNLVKNGLTGIGEGINGMTLNPQQPPTPLMPGSYKQIPRDTRLPSLKRPNAAPDPRSPPNQGASDPRVMASFLRQQVEASSAPRTTELTPSKAHSTNTTSIPSSLSIAQNPTLASTLTPIGFDPKRRPSGKVNGPPQLPQIRIPPRDAMNGPKPSLSPLGPRAGPGQLSGPPSQLAHQGLRQGPPLLQSSNPFVMTPSSRSPLPSAFPATGYFPPGVQAATKPVRASTDRSYDREQMAAGHLRKNTSPAAGQGPSDTSYDAVSHSRGLSPVGPPASGGDRRSPNSPNGIATSPHESAERGPGGQAPPSNGAPGRSRANSPAPSFTSARNGGAPRPIGHDAKGFVLGSGIPCRSIPENRDALEKWQAILAEDDLTAARKNKKVKKLVEAGIPDSIRGKVWLFLANGGVRRRPGLFEQLCRASQDAKKGRKGKEAAYEAIEKDVGRSFPDNKLFQDGQPGKADLEAILKAYTHYNPIIGYTQGMGLLVGIFLLHMVPEDAFWLLCALLRDVHMEGYYSNEMKQLHIDGVMFGQLLHSLDNPLASHLQKLALEPLHFTPNWFLPLYCRVLPWPTLWRVIDMLFYEGPTWIMQVALAIVRIVREPLMRMDGPTAREDALLLLLHPPAVEVTPENVMTCALSVKLKNGELRKLSRNASKLVRGSKSNLSPIGMGSGGDTGGGGGGVGAATGMQART